MGIASMLMFLRKTGDYSVSGLIVPGKCIYTYFNVLIHTHMYQNALHIHVHTTCNKYDYT